MFSHTSSLSNPCHRVELRVLTRKVGNPAGGGCLARSTIPGIGIDSGGKESTAVAPDDKRRDPPPLSLMKEEWMGSSVWGTPLGPREVEGLEIRLPVGGTGCPPRGQSNGACQAILE